MKIILITGCSTGIGLLPTHFTAARVPGPIRDFLLRREFRHPPRGS